ncbi:MAG: 50S ribosomal protein L17 [Nitrospinae bacterium]|nr:50S ribosomal protein L17 [Nitrospinota bacterium]MBF0634312.1 50S ribosomal protein L17 [Nitrospinota bacterium]
MRHLALKRGFGRTTSHRIAMFRNMVTSLLEFEKITTTLPKAKELRRIAEKMITHGKKGTLAQRRLALGYVREEKVVGKLFGPLAERYKTRPGGYTRIFKLGYRAGDAAPMAVIELVDRDAANEPKRRTRKPAKEEAAKA